MVDQHLLRLCRRVKYFVADTPHDDARMVAVSSQEAGQILFPPIFEIVSVVVRCFLGFPAVESLIHDHQTHLISKPVKLRREGVVSSAYGIDTHFFE